jgi:excisionase family DNA binding protein
MDVALLTIGEAAHFLGIGRSFMYSKLLQTGEISTVRLGRAVRIPRSSLDEYVARLTSAAR